jgi:hypothetical protein
MGMTRYMEEKGMNGISRVRDPYWPPHHHTIEK